VKTIISTMKRKLSASEGGAPMGSPAELSDEQCAKKAKLVHSQALIEGARRGDIQACIKAMRDGADVAFQSCGLTPLFYASFYGHTMIIDYLVNSGANVNERNLSGLTPLSKAVEVGVCEAVKSLLAHDANPNIADNAGNTPLIKASRMGRTDIVQVLIEKGRAQIDARNNEKNTALHEASAKGNLDIVKYLLEKKAYVNFPNQLGKTPLHRAVTGNHMSVTKLLLEYPVDVNIQDSVGFTALHYGAFNGNMDCIKLLVNKYADLDLTDKNKRTAEMVAQSRRHLNIIDFLGEHRKKVHVPFVVLSPLDDLENGGEDDIDELE